MIKTTQTKFIRKILIIPAIIAFAAFMLVPFSLVSAFDSKQLNGAEKSTADRPVKTKIEKQVQQTSPLDGDLTITTTAFIDPNMVRTHLPAQTEIDSGSSVITVPDAAEFSAGDEILILTIDGISAGTYETATISALNTTQISITTPLLNSYDGADQIIIQKIPHYGVLTIENGGELTVPMWDGQNGGVIALRADQLIVEAGGRIIADQRGFEGQTGPGAGTPFGRGGGGAGHGGAGGAGGTSETSLGGAGLAYGNLYTPMTLGSGGGNNGGIGGGLVFINAATLQLDGEISSDGGNGSASGIIDARAAGSGGSIWLWADQLLGAGVIRANGGNVGGARAGSARGGAGGGGRIAINATIESYTGLIQAQSGGANLTTMAESGTVFINDGGAGGPVIDPISSTLQITPAIVNIDGSVATVEVNLVDMVGDPIANRPVSITIVGTDVVVTDSTSAVVLPESGNQVDGQLYDLGFTNSNGVVSATLNSTAAGIKQIEAWSGFVRIAETARTSFVGAVPVAAQSDLGVIVNNVDADRVTPAQLRVTVRDQYGNVVPNTTDEIAIQPSDVGVVISPTTGQTDENGIVDFYITSDVPRVVSFTATINEAVLPTQQTLNFFGPELEVVVFAPNTKARLQPIDFSVRVRNYRPLPAENSQISITIPLSLTEVVFDQPVTQLDAETYIWDLGDFVGGEQFLNISAFIGLEAEVGEVLQILAQASTSSIDIVPANNTSQQNIMVLQEAPQISVSLSKNSIDVRPGISNTLRITLTNDGQLPLNNTTVQLDGAFPWLNLPVQNLGTLDPFGGTTSFTIVANPTLDVTPGHYNSELRISGDDFTRDTVLIRAYVQPPLRDLMFNVVDDENEPLADTFITLVSTRTIYSAADPIFETVTHRAFSDASGQATFLGLETGKNYVVSAVATDYQPLDDFICDLWLRGAGAKPKMCSYRGFRNCRSSLGELNILTAAGDDQAQTVVVRNSGVSDLTNIQIAAPTTDIQFAYIGRTTTGTISLTPSEAYTFTFNTSVPVSQTSGVLEGELRISADQLADQVVPVAVEVDNGILVDYCVSVVLKPLQTTLKGVRVTLTELESVGLPFQREVYTDSGTGLACFTSIPSDPYQLTVDWQGTAVVNEEVEVNYDLVQYQEFEIDYPSVEATWTVEPTTIEDVYTTTLTLDFRAESPPLLTASPREMRICEQDADGLISEMVTIHNFFPVEFTNVRVGLGYLGEVGDITATLVNPANGDSVVEDGILSIGAIGPNEDVQLQLDAQLNQAVCSNASGTVFLRVFADYSYFLPAGWYDVDQPIDSVPLGLPASIPLKLAHRGFPEESNLNQAPPDLVDVTLTPPQTLDWMDVSTQTFPLIQAGTDVSFTLDINAPEWLPNGIYQDYILITSTNSITTVIGIVAERTDLGLEVETRFVTPLTVQESNSPKVTIYPHRINILRGWPKPLGA